MNDTFLNSVASYIQKKHSENLAEIVIVVPNIRAGLYFRRSFAKSLSKASWAPQILSVQDFFHNQSGLQTEEQIPLVFELYKSFQRVAPQLFESFDLFYPWGEVLLSDFNDVDSNLAESKQLFTNIKDLKQLEMLFSDLEKNILDVIRRFWSNLEGESASEAKARFLAVWKQILPVYQDFKLELAKKGLGYEGMIYREVAENLNNELFPEPKKQHYFVGFNVLSQSEQFVFRYFKNQYQSGFFWQYDELLLKHPEHEAFQFIRKYLQEFPNPIDFKYPQSSRKKSIKIYAVPSKTAQVKLASSLLTADFAKVDPDFERSALILPDESLLQPVLYSMPPEIKHLNVSMGFPIAYAPQASLVKILALLQENQSKGKFYHKDVLRLLNHPLLRAIDSETCSDLKQSVIENNWLRIPQEQLQKGHNILKMIFRSVDDLLELGHYFTDALKSIYEEISQLPDMEFDCEIIYQLYRRINRFNEFLLRDKIQFQSIKTYLLLQNSMLNSVSVAFSGEPLRGLQVLGMLETRLLDFDQMIIMSMNEGHFPGQSFKKSFIPYNLRNAFQLPTIELQDAIHAYYFYRMIMYPEKLILIYNVADEGFMKGERSRYIQQLMVESKFDIENIPVHVTVQTKDKQVLEVQKDAHSLAVLEKYQSGGGRSFSPSQLNTYIHCSMAFYYKYILGVREEDELVDQIGAMESGNVLHNSLKVLYDPYLNKSITHSDFDALIADKHRINEVIIEAWKGQMKKAGGLEVTGLNALGIESVKIYVDRVLKLDQKCAPVRYLGGELELEKAFSVTIGEKQMQITLKGSIDHLDFANQVIRVMDYKTGGVKTLGFKEMANLFMRERKSDLDYAFQVMFYAWLFMDHSDFNTYQDTPIMPLVLFTRSNEVAQLSENKELVNDSRELLADWKDEMSALIAEILNPEKPFCMTSEKTHCDYCPFQSLCY
ncbi:MAG: PD-(D/E)XK nuclease family protein [Bacteroidota bacterium]|nr:PD-(D/E)XK nuclease family protein [Bacteroidota bacterium]